MSWTLLPPAPGKCPVCAAPQHDDTMPHNAQSLYFQYHFYAEHGRWPTWRDALADTPAYVKKVWERELAEHGVTLDGPVNPQ